MVPKKNSKRVVPNSKKPIGSKRWKDYECWARTHLRMQHKDAILEAKPHTLHVKAIYYCPDRRFPDTSGMHETVGDLLEGIVYKNDLCVDSWDGSRVRLDRKNPRIEIEVSYE